MSATTPNPPTSRSPRPRVPSLPPVPAPSIELGLTLPITRAASAAKPAVIPTQPALPDPVVPASLIPAPTSPVVHASPVVQARPVVEARPVVRERTAPSARRADDVLVPNVVIPGVSHAGAAVLAGQLGRHPQVCLPSVKRIGHFSSLRYGRPVHEPLEEYDRHFARWTGQRYRLENAPDYFDGGLPMARQVAESLPGVRVVLVLRDPSERLWSSYTDKLARARLPRAMGFEAYVERCIALRTNGADRFEGNRHFRTLSSGFYSEYLPAWLETFGRRARVVFTEDLHASAADHVGALFDWLGLDPDDVAPTPGDGGREAYPRSEPSGLSFNRRLWPVRQRSSGARLTERTRARVRALYAGANRELAAQLRDLGYSGLPDWLIRD